MARRMTHVGSLCVPLILIMTTPVLSDEIEPVDPLELEESELTDAETATDQVNPIIEGMRSAQQRISDKKTDEETQLLQKEILKDLDELIKQLSSQRSNRAPPNSPPPPQQRQQQQQQRPEDGRPNQSPRQQSAGGAGRRKPENRASQPTEKSERGRLTKAELERRRHLAREVWGHLPPTLRKELLNIFNENYLPKYEDHIRRYYEALAEQSRKNSRRTSERQ